MPRFHQGAAVIRRLPKATLTGFVLEDPRTKSWCYQEHVAGKLQTLAKSAGWKPYMETTNPAWHDVNTYWLSQIRPLFPNLELN